MRVVVSQITSVSIFTWPFVQARIKKTLKLRVTGLWEGNSPVTGQQPVTRKMLPFDDVIMKLRVPEGGNKWHSLKHDWWCCRYGDYHNRYHVNHYAFRKCPYPSWWRHQMETFSALLSICAGNSPVSGEFPTQRPVTQSFDVIFDLCPNK